MLVLLTAGAVAASAEHLCETNPPAEFCGAGDCGAHSDICDPEVQTCDDVCEAGYTIEFSNGYTIEYVSATYDVPTDTTTFLYLIDGPGMPGTQEGCREVNAVSHVSFAWELCVETPELVFFGSLPKGELLTGLKGDESTGYCVNEEGADLLKTNRGVKCNTDPVPFMVIFEGNVTPGLAEIMLKTGSGTFQADFCGPVCGEQLCGPDHDFEGVDDLCCPLEPVGCGDFNTESDCLSECFPD